MRKDVVEKLKNDSRVKKIMGYFETQFLKGYNDCSRDRRVVDVRETLFRRWYYSALVPMTYLNPNFIINKIAQEYCPGEYVVMPHIQPTLTQGGDVRFRYTYKLFEAQNHPVVEDLKKLVEYSREGLHLDSASGYVIAGGHEFLDEINYRNSYYLMYLIQLARSMKLIKEMKSIGTVCYIPGTKYEEFLDGETKDILVKIVKASCDIAAVNINEDCYMIDRVKPVDIRKSLNNGIDLEYYDSIYKVDNYVIKELMEAAVEDGIEMGIEMDADEAVRNIVSVHLSLQTDKHLTSVFGYYLGLISPNYSVPCNVSRLMSNLLNTEDYLDREGFMFMMDDGHDLTSLGESISRHAQWSVSSNRLLGDFNSGNLDAISSDIEKHVQLVLEDKEEEGMLQMMEADAAYSDEDPFNRFVDDEERRYEAEVKEYVDRFFFYLREEKGVSQRTAAKHAGNVWEYCMHQDPSHEDYIIGDLNGEMFKEYMDMFVEELATSKSCVTEQFTSFNQYAAYLQKNEIITKEELQKIKNIGSKDKDYYIEKFYNSLRNLTPLY